MEKDSQKLPSALARLAEIRATAGGRDFAVFLDYDGTLTPIVARPELAVLSGAMRDTVRRLAAHARVAVISGRDLADVRAMVGLENIFYAGSHGFEIQGPGGWHLDSSQVMDFLPYLDRAEKKLRGDLAGVEGSLVERKRFSIAVHYRLVRPEEYGRIEQAVAAALDAFPELRKTAGKKVYELQPRIDWNKGKAVRWLIDALGLDLAAALPVFIGDDITDEDAFRALEGDGVCILVRDEPRPTAARYGLEGPDEVGAFLEHLRSWAAGPA